MDFLQHLQNTWNKNSFIFLEKNRGSEANELQKAEGHEWIYWEVQGETYGGGPPLVALIKFGSGDVISKTTTQ